MSVSGRRGGADKNEGGWGGTPSPKNVSLSGAGVDLPECQEQRWCKHKKVRVKCEVTEFLIEVAQRILFEAGLQHGFRRATENTPRPLH